jgi:hypothetical protein
MYVCVVLSCAISGIIKGVMYEYDLERKLPRGVVNWYALLAELDEQTESIRYSYLLAEHICTVSNSMFYMKIL